LNRDQIFKIARFTGCKELERKYFEFVDLKPVKRGVVLLKVYMMLVMQETYSYLNLCVILITASIICSNIVAC